MTTIDRIFRGYGEEFFGKAFMDGITDSQVEEARVWAFNELDYLTRKYGKQEKGTVKELFCNCLFGELTSKGEML